MKLCSNGHDLDVVGLYSWATPTGRARRCKVCKRAEALRASARRSDRRRRRARRRALGLDSETAPPRRVRRRTGTSKPAISPAASEIVLDILARAENMPHWMRADLVARAAAIASGGAE